MGAQNSRAVARWGFWGLYPAGQQGRFSPPFLFQTEFPESTELLKEQSEELEEGEDDDDDDLSDEGEQHADRPRSAAAESAVRQRIVAPAAEAGQS